MASSASIDISVVIICFNAVRTVGAAIESALSQRCAANYEIVVVDDASSDGSADLIQKYAEAHRAVTCIQSPENRGHVEAARTGINASRGSFFVRLDADDVFLPGLLAALWEKHMLTRADIIMANHIRFFHDTKKRETVIIRDRVPDFIMCGNLISKQAYDETGGLRKLLFEEYDLFMRLKDRKYSWAFADCALYEYTQHRKSICRQQNYWSNGLKELLTLWTRGELLNSGFEDMLKSLDNAN